MQEILTRVVIPVGICMLSVFILDYCLKLSDKEKEQLEKEEMDAKAEEEKQRQEKRKNEILNRCYYCPDLRGLRQCFGCKLGNTWLCPQHTEWIQFTNDDHNRISPACKSCCYFYDDATSNTKMESCINCNGKDDGEILAKKQKNE